MEKKKKLDICAACLFITLSVFSFALAVGSRYSQRFDKDVEEITHNVCIDPTLATREKDSEIISRADKQTADLKEALKVVPNIDKSEEKVYCIKTDGAGNALICQVKLTQNKRDVTYVLRKENNKWIVLGIRTV